MTLLEVLFSKDHILSNKSQEEVFEYYFGEPIDIYKTYQNPLRNDKSPGCSFYYNENDNLIFYDHSKGKSYNWIEFAKDHTGITNYHDLIRKIGKDLKILKTNNSKTVDFNKIFNRNKNKKVVKKKNPLEDIKFIYTEIRPEHYDYWSTWDYQFTLDDFLRFRTLPFEYYIQIFKDKKYMVYEEPIGFIYFLSPDKKQKQCYLPFVEKSRKFRHIRTENIFGLETLQEGKGYVLITKSKKDHNICQLAGINSCFILAENYKFLFSDYLKLKKFGKIYTLFDPDETGINRSNEFKKEFYSTPLFLDVLVKDTYGHYKEYGLQSVKETLKGMIPEHKE